VAGFDTDGIHVASVARPVEQVEDFNRALGRIRAGLNAKPGPGSHEAEAATGSHARAALHGGWGCQSALVESAPSGRARGRPSGETFSW
jgi:hypothetical protein